MLLLLYEQTHGTIQTPNGSEAQFRLQDGIVLHVVICFGTSGDESYGARIPRLIHSFALR
mgnify:CR=1 FL=1